LKKGFKYWLAFAAIYIIWGTTYLAIKIGIEDFPPFIMASIRYFIAGVILLLICFFSERVRQAPAVMPAGKEIFSLHFC